MNVIPENSVDKKQNYIKQWIYTMLTNITMLTYGMQGGWVSPMTKILQSDSSPAGHPLTDFEISLIASVLCISAIFGTLIFAFTIDRFGRKTGVLLIAVLQLACWVGILLARSTVTLIIARIFSGLAAGGCYNVVPIYVKEISDIKIRGKLGSLFTFFQNLGFLTMYVIGAYLDYYVVLYVVIGLSIITVISLLTIPETPDFLIKQQKYDQAQATIANLRGLDPDDKFIQNELETMKFKIKELETMPQFNVINVFKNKAIRRGVILGWAMVTASATSGNFAVLSYASFILQTSGVTFSPEVQAISIPLVMIFGSLLSVFCVERFGRKLILGTTCSAAVISMFTIATIILVQQYGGWVPPWLSVLSIVIYQFSYAAGISSMPYIVSSEMFNFQMRAKITGSFAINGWFSSFCLLLTFKSISNTFGLYSNFYSYAFVNLCGALVSLLLLPETKGKSIEAIQEELKGNLLILPTRKYLKSEN